jgi:two-component system response regulator YcbB
MDFIRGKRAYGGKVSLKKFIESLMIQADRMLSEYTV